MSEAERHALKKMLRQQETLQMIERNGFVFDDIGAEPGNWQHLAFTLYTEICDMDEIARQALGMER